MPIFVERYVLAALVVLLGALVLTNPMQWGWPARIFGIVADIVLAFLFAFFLYRHIQKKSSPEKSKRVEPERIFVNETTDYLVSLVKDHTSINRPNVASPFIGKWRRISGTVHDVSQAFFTGVNMFIIVVHFCEGDTAEVTRLEFSQEWKGRLEILKRGQTINVAGEIAAIEDSGVSLRKCELISPPN